MSACSHRVRLYDDRGTLAAEVADFLAPALRDGAAIVIARRGLLDDTHARLVARGHDVTAACAAGRLVAIDAETALAAIARDGAPDRERFDAYVGAMLAAARAVCGHRAIHIYGEIVDLLWERGERESVLALEQLWQERLRDEPVSLMCGYRVAAFGAGDLHELGRICALHDDADARRGRAEYRMHRLLAVSGDLAAAKSSDDIARLAIEEGIAALGATSAALWLLHDGHLALARQSAGVPGGIDDYRTIELDANLPITRALGTGEGVFFGSREIYAREHPGSYARVADIFEGELALALLPIVAERGPLGVLCFTFDHAREFNATDRAFKAIFARQCALALERVALQTEERSLREAAERAMQAEKVARIDAEQLYELATAMSSLDDLELIFQLALDTAIRGTGSARAALLARDNEGSMRFKASSGLSAACRRALDGHSPWGADAESPTPVLVDDAELDPAWTDRRELFRAEGIRALAYVPVVFQRKLIGALVLCRDLPLPFGAREAKLATTVAIHVAQALERKRTERELARAYRVERDARLEAEEATRAREEILSVVSHDLRNPLGTVMMGASTLLLGDGRDNPRLRAVAERIHRQAERMSRLIEDLVDFAGIQAGRLAIERRRHAPEEIIAAARELFGPLAQERGLVFEAQMPAGLPSIECDSDRAVQVLANLVSNAFKVTPKGGRVEIGAESTAKEIVFFVHDTGPGIDPDDLPNLFERFWRSKNSRYKGSGLGLSIARGIVDAHGGRIWAESQVGVGSTFYFSLSSLQN